ncbi:serine/threonine-protein kinase Nek4 isoform X2 [Xyrichtys novacula]|uniref:Serine/threonine-protein kinase Nek4 n=1 Tax=Xyrichtys novacula TaxID=13765 RepID=A0AAV1ES91_XYRNO|nr:serine/threonine-protein kinase Nek4 isoform X2 [Xyrichtys novacula]
MMNNYIFIRVVGKGSYGEVNLVKHKTDRKQYVIKKLNLTTSSKRERRAAEQEAQLLSQLHHPNIVTYRESWEGDDCQLYIVMGFCEGGDLYHRLKQQKGELLPERQVVEWFVQIAMALQYLHERNILHRDLKTQNIFLTKTNIIKVGDLGIARVLENQNDMASTLIGTPYYMSPELFSNKPYNYKSDVWALGCCVYEMSTLKHAFNAKDMNSLVYRIVEGKLPQMPSRYDPQLGELIKSMLCKRPEDRPDVKLILRQPYIKKQIAMFLEATKEKTAKSRKKAVDGSGDCKGNSASTPAASSQSKPKKSPQHEPPTRVKRKEEKSQQHKVQNGVPDCTHVHSPQPPKPSSPDALKSSIVSMATVSNIDIDIKQPQQEEEDLLKRQTQESQSVSSHHKSGNEPLTHSVHTDRKTRGKPDPSPPLKSVSGVGSRGIEEKGSSSELPDIHSKAKSNHGDTFSLCAERKLSPEEDKDDTMELLKEADKQNPKVEVEKEAAYSVPVRRAAQKSNMADIGITVEMILDNNNDTITLLKGAQTQHHTSATQENLENTEKLLEPFPPILEESMQPASKQVLATTCQTPLSSPSEPFVSAQFRGRRALGEQDQSKVAAPRPLPPPPVVNTAAEGRRRTKRSIESKRAGGDAISSSVSSIKDGVLPLDRPLSARERRRLRQSQESASQSVNAVRRASYDVTSTRDENHNNPVSRSVSDLHTETKGQNKIQEQRSDEDECSSSTSSTERSEGDYRDRKSEPNDMQDLVHMMTQTLRMDIRDGVSDVDNKDRFGSTSLPEFKLNRKYRDTLVLHGKARGEAEDLSLGEIPTGFTSGPAKVRRAIENLRTDVVKGLGVKLLDKALEIMEEEDDTKRELRLRDQMGDEKYHAYAVMVRQLKFFEDIALKV